eukprot:TRINITY_DN52603_c0_g1_i1.p1 TRINITY_DN52603_c0_g1~~TRINITY_DN52603_c0_g1_i1.p1  ORF type:complete len:103 (+),score=9.04 TRINITY_DN52603_c0_g1_i1:34-342(+)
MEMHSEQTVVDDSLLQLTVRFQTIQCAWSACATNANDSAVVFPLFLAIMLLSQYPRATSVDVVAVGQALGVLSVGVKLARRAEHRGAADNLSTAAFSIPIFP